MLGPVNRAIRLATLVAALVGGAFALVVIVLVSRAIARPVQRRPRCWARSPTARAT